MSINIFENWKRNSDQLIFFFRIIISLKHLINQDIGWNSFLWPSKQLIIRSLSKSNFFQFFYWRIMMEVIIGEINWIYWKINTIGSGVDLIKVDKNKHKHSEWWTFLNSRSFLFWPLSTRQYFLNLESKFLSLKHFL